MNTEADKGGLGELGQLDIERLVMAVFQGSGDCIKILDLDGRLQFMSEGGRRVMEVEDFSALKGRLWPQFWPDEASTNAADAIARAREGRSVQFKGPANTAKGTPRYWDVRVSPIFAGDGKVSHLLSISRDITEEARATASLEENYTRQKFLVEELTHRAKNTLATVIAIARQTFRGEAHKDPRELFDARIKTLSDAYNILSESSWSTTSIRRVVESALAPYRADPGRFTIAGPDTELKSNQALTLALAINELATNAMKYGALSGPSGKVEISWTTNPRFEFVWRETGGPAVTAPTRSGFGTRLIKNLLAEDFGGAVDLAYNPEGLICSLTVKA